jgi:DNA-binding NarL/FixJ family response regulator
MIADDHPVFRLGVRALLAAEPDITLVAEAADGEEALRLMDDVRPDLILLDLSMPGQGGMAALAQITKKYPHIRVVVLTAALSPGDSRQALMQGAQGLLLKHTASDLLVKCIRAVADGQYWVRRDGVAEIIDALRSKPENLAATLTPRELEIIRGVVRAESNKEIASRLEIGEQTVKNHLRNIFEKVGVSNRVELALKALEQKLVAD